jgi:hypothetical protein
LSSVKKVWHYVSFEKLTFPTWLSLFHNPRQFLAVNEVSYFVERTKLPCRQVLLFWNSKVLARKTIQYCNFTKEWIYSPTKYDLNWKKTISLDSIFDVDSNGIKIFRKKTSECGEFVPVTKVHHLFDRLAFLLYIFQKIIIPSFSTLSSRHFGIFFISFVTNFYLKTPIKFE